jgi:hypothetical protein
MKPVCSQVDPRRIRYHWCGARDAEFFYLFQHYNRRVRLNCLVMDILASAAVQRITICNSLIIGF